MAAKLGIYTRYHQHELTRAGIQLAEMAIEHGIPTTLKSTDVCRREVSLYWDSKVVGPKVSFNKWAHGLTHILWTECPAAEEVRWTTQNGIVPWLLALWDNIQPEHSGTLRLFDRVITPYECMAEALSRMKSIKPYVLSWDNTFPITSKSCSIYGGCVQVLVPIIDNQSERVDFSIFDMLERVICMRPQVAFTVVAGKGWTRKAIKRRDALAKSYPRQVVVIKGGPGDTLQQRMQLYGSHDVTLWLSQWEGMGMVGIDSLKAGTPVIAWDNKPQTEYLETGLNSCLIPCQVKRNWLGMGEVTPDYAAATKHLLSVVDDDHFRQLLQKRAASHGIHRHEKLQQRWLGLWA